MAKEAKTKSVTEEKNKKPVDNKTKRVEAKQVEVKKTKVKRPNKLLLWVKDNRKPLLFGLVGVAIGCVTMLVLSPVTSAKLSNGEQVIVELKNGDITAEDLFEELKRTGGLSALINLMDNSILNDKYDLDKEAADYAKTQAQSYYTMYESYYGYTKEQFLEANGFATEEAFLDYLENEFLYNRYYEDYLKSIVTEKDIQDYYKKEVFGAKKVYVFSSTEKKHSLESVRKELKKGTKASKIEKKFKDVVINELEIDFTTVANYSDTFVTTLKGLEANKYSKVFADDTYGNVVLYVTEVKETPELKDVEDKIIEVISAKLDAEDDTLYYKAYQELREAYGMKFYDDLLEKEYNDSMAPYLEKKSTEKSE